MTAVTYTTYSFGDRDNGWWLEYRSDTNVVTAHKRIQGEYSKATLDRRAANTFVAAQQAKGREVRKFQQTREVKPIPADNSTINFADNGIEAGGAGMLEAKVVDPRRAANPVVAERELNRNLDDSRNWSRSFDMRERGPRRDEGEERDAEVKPAERKNAVRDGIYTVVMQDGERRTIRVRTYDEGNFAGKTILSFLSGPDNEFSYTGFAFLDGSRVIVWKRFQDQNSLAVAAARVLADPKTAGQAYALESGKCYRCSRTLTVPSSIDAGLGPVCAGKMYGN